jgi:hypothetical protein
MRTLLNLLRLSYSMTGDLDMVLMYSRNVPVCSDRNGVSETSELGMSFLAKTFAIFKPAASQSTASTSMPPADAPSNQQPIVIPSLTPKEEGQSKAFV